jgi:hypothetical protein
LFDWSQKNKVGIERMEELIIVSGCTLATSSAAAAFVDNTEEAESLSGEQYAQSR